jgi:hypothetical protein
MFPRIYHLSVKLSFKLPLSKLPLSNVEMHRGGAMAEWVSKKTTNKPGMNT